MSKIVFRPALLIGWAGGAGGFTAIGQIISQVIVTI